MIQKIKVCCFIKCTQTHLQQERTIKKKEEEFIITGIDREKAVKSKIIMTSSPSINQLNKTKNGTDQAACRIQCK